MADLQNEKKWAEHLPSEGENLERATKNETRQGVEATAQRHQQDASAAPSQADPKAAEENREFVEDVAMKYNDAEEANARKDQGR